MFRDSAGKKHKLHSSVHNLRIASGIACTFIGVLFQRSWGLFYDEFSSCVYTPEN